MAVEIASDFLKKPLNQMDNTIDNTLAKIGKDMDVDRTYIFESSKEDNQIMSCGYTWCASGVTPRIDNNQGKPFVVPPWMCGQIFKHKPVQS